MFIKNGLNKLPFCNTDMLGKLLFWKWTRDTLKIQQKSPKVFFYAVQTDKNHIIVEQQIKVHYHILLTMMVQQYTIF